MVTRNRWVLIGAIGIVVLLILLLAPWSGGGQQGSTYSRAPGGYGAWYASMQGQGAEIQRWQKPLGELFQTDSPRTLLQIPGRNGWQNFPDLEWVNDGNVVVLLGIEPERLGFNTRSTITNAPFTSVIPSPNGDVTIQTHRRFPIFDRLPNPTPNPTPSPTSIQHIPADSPARAAQSMLSDAYGAIVQAWSYGEGQIIFVVTPHLAANAYQDAPGNFSFLAQLVQEPGNPIWVDEYLHGYKDTEAIAGATSQSLIRYLAQTPILIVAVQALVVLLVLIWGFNQRFGAAVKLTEPAIDNSKAYIQALAAVLRKANCSEFVVSTIARAEQIQIQRSLGLGADLLPPDRVMQAWTQQAGQSSLNLNTDLNIDLKDVLHSASKPDRLNEPALLRWLEKLKRIHQALNTIKH
jgi:hypothetical protein